MLYRVSPALGSDEVNDLFAAAWGHHERRDFDPVLQRSLVYICAYRRPSLVGFVNVVWDGARTLSSWTRETSPQCLGRIGGPTLTDRTRSGSMVCVDLSATGSA